MALPLRHELKFLVTRTQLEVLRHVVAPVLHLDPNAVKNGGLYHIRSLYFDTAFDDSLYEKYSGVMNRDKYRMRIYNMNGQEIFLECKTKVGTLISKRSVKIPRDLAEQLIAGDPTGLENTRSGLLRTCTGKCAPGFCIPWSSWITSGKRTCTPPRRCASPSI